MHSKSLPIVNRDTDIKEIISTVSEKKLGLVIVQENNKIVGIITDGDIRRAMESMEEKFFTLKAKDLMSINPKTIDPKAKLMEAQTMMAKYKVNSLLVSKSDTLIGVVQIYDLEI
jgi:arabinose-5-phosphate isomerase